LPLPFIFFISLSTQINNDVHINGVFALQGCYSAYVGNCLLTFRDSLAVPFSMVKES